MNEFDIFQSIFKEEIIEYIKYKKLCGYEYSKKTYGMLKRLDVFFKEQNLTEKKITTDITDKWFIKNPNNSKLTKSIKYNTITSFSKFLISKGYKDIFIIPENPYHCSCSFIPYIYSKEEIIKIFNILKANKTNENGFLIYTCISILYCCGLRVGELVNLKLKDFNYENNTLIIEKGKNNVTRLIPLTEKLTKLVKEYIDKNIYLSNDDFIFNNKISRDYLCNVIRTNFRKVLTQIEILNTYENKLPRLHDLRHTFAIHTLNNMLEKGFKLYECLPTLSVYLGHKSIYETEYYLRLPETNFKEVTNKVFEYTCDIYIRKDGIYNGE